MPTTVQPVLKFGPPARRSEEILLLCYYEPWGVSTVPENVAFLQLFSEFSITVLNMCEHRQSTEGLPLSDRLNLDKFDGLIIHNTVSYSVDNLRSLDTRTKVKIKDFNGVKVLMKQDENYRFDELADYIAETGFDLICTCLPEKEQRKIYPESKVRDTKFLQMLTGYVTPTLRRLAFKQERRPIDIGYRGSIQPLSFGRLAYEKRKIGDDLNELLRNSGLRLDISSRWEDRIGGEDWLSFLGSCRATVGAESGASVFDLGGELARRCKVAEKELGPLSESPQYAERFLEYFSDLEGNVDYAQVSPRHFEAVATGTLQMLYPGNYSGILLPRRHYVPLKRDYSNLEEALEYLIDDRLSDELVTCARDEIVENKRYWTEAFVEQLDNHLDSLVNSNGRRKAHVKKLTSSAASNVLLICAHVPEIDPRLGWIAAHCPSPLIVHTLGVLPPDSADRAAGNSPEGGVIYASPRITFEPNELKRWYRLIGEDSAGIAAIQEVLMLDHLLGLSPHELAEALGAPFGHERLVDFRWYLKYFLDTCATLVTTASGWSGLSAIVATDLDALLPGIILSRIQKIPLVYDAHELWSESDVRNLEFEKSFWSQLEGRLLPLTDARFTVSPGLAAHQERLHGHRFGVLPNCEPISGDTPACPLDEQDYGKCRFLFQGAFAEGRGLRELIAAWPLTVDPAVLLLRGKPNAFRDELIKQAKATKLYNERIFFPAAVAEEELVHAAATSADVGLVPYPKTNTLYANCSPNKLSQYMAASLPVLANDTNFVRDVVNEADCGIVVNFGNTQVFVDAVNALASDETFRKRCSQNSLDYFKTTFHWQHMAQSFYQHLTKLGAGKSDVLTDVASSTESYYLEEPNLASAVRIARSVQWALAEANGRKTFAGKCRVLLRPIWQRIPGSSKDRLRQLFSTAS